MSNTIPCRYCEDDFRPCYDKPGWYDVCPRCTEKELNEQPELEPEPLVAGISEDEAGTFSQIVPKRVAMDWKIRPRAFTCWDDCNPAHSIRWRGGRDLATQKP